MTVEGTNPNNNRQGEESTTTTDPTDPPTPNTQPADPRPEGRGEEEEKARGERQPEEERKAKGEKKGGARGRPGATTEKTNRPNERNPSPTAATSEATNQRRPTTDDPNPSPRPRQAQGTTGTSKGRTGRGKEDEAGPDHDTAQARLFAIQQGLAVSRAMPGQGS